MYIYIYCIYTPGDARHSLCVMLHITVAVYFAADNITSVRRTRGTRTMCAGGIVLRLRHAMHPRSPSYMPGRNGGPSETWSSVAVMLSRLHHNRCKHVTCTYMPDTYIYIQYIYIYMYSYIKTVPTCICVNDRLYIGNLRQPDVVPAESV